MSRWKELGVVDTIYEEENEHSSSSSPPLSPSLSSSPTPLHSRVLSRSLATGRKTDVSIYVMGTCFCLHKDPLTSRSAYLKRQLTELSEITLPLNITAETFSLIADFCYGAHLIITPFNVASLRTAAELLEMTETNGKRDENLQQITEAYFRRVVAVNRELLWIAFRSSLGLLPDSETTAFLLSRCIQALDLTGRSDELDNYLDDVIDLPAEAFQIAAESIQCRFISHDSLYRIVDLYIKVHSGMLTEEQKNDICNFMDCNKLSPQFLIHAVQNPRLPLRFIVRAMFMEQLNTRRAVLSTAIHKNNHASRGSDHGGTDPVTLGAILRRDAAVREAAQLKVEMDATNNRIESLEKELDGMKKLLQKSEKERSIMQKKLREQSNKERIAKEDKVLHYPKKLSMDLESEGNVNDSSTEKADYEPEMDVIMSVLEPSARSASFHYGSRDAKIERGERGSTSFSGFHLRSISGETSAGSSLSKPIASESPRTKEGLITRLKRRLWVSKSAPKCNNKSKPANREYECQGENGNGCDIRTGELLSLPQKQQ